MTEMAAPEIAPAHVAKVPTDYLEFDPENPRLAQEGEHRPSDAEIILALAGTADLAEVVQSNAANGYFDIEPLIGLRIGSRWRVLEGNRRLAAIRILQNPALAKGTGKTVPEISEQNLATLKEVSVYARLANTSGSSTSMDPISGKRSRKLGSRRTGTAANQILRSRR